MRKINEAGEVLLSFCALNEMAITNTSSRRKQAIGTLVSILAARSGIALTM